jgi:hypothetical protein
MMDSASGYAFEDGTICFVSDKVHRVCANCGTVFTVSACLVGLFGPGDCPYCGGGETSPIPGIGMGRKPRKVP